MFPGFCPARFGVLFCGECSAADTHRKLLDRAVSGAQFRTLECLSVTLLIVDLLLFCVCCIRTGVTRCTRLMMCYLDRMCQCGLHAVPWSHIGILTLHLAAEPRSTAGLLFRLLTPYSMVGDWRVSRAGPMLFYWPKPIKMYIRP